MEDILTPGTLNQFTLSDPVIATSGDLYIGFFDLVADSGATYLLDYDRSFRDSQRERR
jgi:hypothetical protein